MDGLRTRGQPVAVAAIRAMLGSRLAHAVLLTGPAGVGKTTLALDIAAALLCQAANGEPRPCRACRGCRMVDHANHPDLHRLAPAGAGSLISIGGPERPERGVRDLVLDLALMPVEGGARVAIVEKAHRMTEDAQSACLKTLEEPPAGTTIILCADDEERMLPTIRSRCARVRLGPMGPRDVEAILEEQGVADPPTAARLARIADGRPGHAIAYARAPEAATIRAEIARSLLDLLGAGVTGRLTGVRDLGGRAAELVGALDAGAARALDAAGVGSSPSGKGRGRGTRAAGGTRTAGATRVPGASPEASAEAVGDGAPDGGAAPEAAESGARIPAAERRRAALVLVEIWRAVVRDLGLAVAGERGGIRDLALIDDLETAARGLDLAAVGHSLRRLETAGERLEGNVSPELVLDVLGLGWTTGSRSSGSAA
jgi:DNA polymerase-3 subunit delta'